MFIAAASASRLKYFLEFHWVLALSTRIPPVLDRTWIETTSNSHMAPLVDLTTAVCRRSRFPSLV